MTKPIVFLIGFGSGILTGLILALLVGIMVSRQPSEAQIRQHLIEMRQARITAEKIKNELDAQPQPQPYTRP